jgi:hypothetical protein
MFPSRRPRVTVSVSLLAAAHDDDRHSLADGGLGDDPRQFARVAHLAAVEADDHVAGLHAGRAGGPVRLDASDQRAAPAAEVEALGNLVGDLLDAHAEPAAPRLAELAQLRDDRPGGIGGNGEGDADIAAGLREDRRVDADDVAGHVEQRTRRNCRG